MRAVDGKQEIYLEWPNQGAASSLSGSHLHDSQHIETIPWLDTSLTDSIFPNPLALLPQRKLELTSRL